MVVNKPAMILTVPDRYAPGKFNLKDFLKERYGKIFVVHRLDKETSGALVFARHADAHRRLSLDFENRRVEKIYWALVQGQMVEDSGTIDKPLARSTVKYNKMLIHPRGKASRTDFRVLERFRYFTLVQARIHTGRLHQIRVHLASIGYPLAVDYLYGGRSEFKLSEIKRGKYKQGKEAQERPLMTRVSLHARSLGFTHPGTGQHLNFTAELPKDFRAVLHQLRKWNKPAH